MKTYTLTPEEQQESIALLLEFRDIFLKLEDSPETSELLKFDCRLADWLSDTIT
jgi:hypothetical protein